MTSPWRRWFHILPAISFVLAATPLLHAQFGPPAVPANQTISGTVVDAVTGKPVAGVNLILSMEYDGEPPYMRSRSVRASASGRFAFPPARATAVEDFSGTARGPVIVANIPPIDPKNGILDVSRVLIREPQMASRSKPQAPKLDNPAYFPMAVRLDADCSQTFNATCLSSEVTDDVRIPLIPIMDGPAGCAAITNRDVREKCRRLQTYRMAFANFDSIARIRAAKQACRDIDHARDSLMCIEDLWSLLVNAKSEGIVVKAHMEGPPAEDVLIVNGIADTLAKVRIVDESALYESIRYLAEYRKPEQRSSSRIAFAEVMMLGEPHAAARAAEQTLKSGQGRPILFDGSPLVLSGGQNVHENVYSVSWTSNDKFITVGLHDDTPPPHVLTDLIRAYLRKYPVTD
jgi:hypothetical protein